MDVVWSDRAADDMATIHAFIARTSPAAADRWAGRLLVRAVQLELYPDSGRPVPEYGTTLLRELIEGPYRLIYERFPDRVELLAVHHGHSPLPKE